MDTCISEAATRGVLYKKLFLEISYNSQENHLCQGLFFNKVAGRGLQLY